MRAEESTGGDQGRLLDQAVKTVKAESFEMKRCLDKGKIMDALKHAMNFLNELKTNELSPKFYYHMDSVSELHHLETYLVDEFERNQANIISLNLYESVQYAASIVPRLYLLVTVGVVYIKCGLGSRPEILSDIVEMCRGVQHPLRGLFLRNYLLQTTRSLLPDFPWDESKTDDEQLNDTSMISIGYHSNCSDGRFEAMSDGAQGTEVNVKNILIALIDRLAIYAVQPNGKGIPLDLQLFDIFSEQSKSLIKARPEMPTDDIIALHNALVSLAIKCYPDKTEYCNITFGSLKYIFEEKGIQSIEAFGPVGRELAKLLRLPVDEYINVLRVAELTEYVPVMETLDYRGRCQNSAYLLQNMLDQETWLKTEEDLAVICALVDSLLTDQSDQPPDAHESEDFEDEQRLLARSVHLIEAEDVDNQFLLLNNLRKVLGAGGKHRIKFTIAPVVFSLYKLISRYSEPVEERDDLFDEKVKKMFVCAMGTIGTLISTAELDELPLKLYLEGAIVSDKVNFEDSSTITYEFMSKALSVLEDDIADSRDRVRCLALSIGSLLQIFNLPDENWSPLSSQMALAASKMFKKADQVRSLCSCANLYWSGQTAESDGPLKNGNKVADVIKKSIKIAAQCMEPVVQQQLFVLILETCLFYYFDDCEEITEENISELVVRTKDNAVQLDVSAEADALEKQFAAVLAFIRSKRNSHPTLCERLHLSNFGEFILSNISFVAAIGGCAFVSCLYAFHLIALFYGKYRLNRKVIHSTKKPGVSIIKPLVGADENLLENLRSFFTLDYHKYELLFCLHDKDDDALEVVHSLIGLFPKVDAQIFFGGEDVGYNPKINNMMPAYRAAKYPFILISDSGILMKPDRLMDMVNSADPDVAIVTQVPYCENRPGEAAALEQIYFGTSHGRIYLAGNAMRFVCSTGMSSLLRKSALEDCGGLQAFGGYLAEDFFFGVECHKRGWKAVISSYPALQNTADITISKFNARICRWMKLRIAMLPHLIFVEPLQDCFASGVIMSLSLKYFFKINPFLWFFGHCGLWFTSDYLLIHVLQNGPLSYSTFTFVKLWLLREAMGPLIFLKALCEPDIEWRTGRFRLKWGGRIRKL